MIEPPNDELLRGEQRKREAHWDPAREGVPVDDLIARGLRLALCETPVVGRQRIAFPLIHSARPGALGVEQVLAAEGKD